MKNEEFEKWMSDYAADAVTVEMVIERLTPREAAFEGYRQRQPEIDALKENNEGLARCVALLRSEVERLRADAERYQHFLDESFKMGMKFTPEADRDYFMEQMRSLHDAAMKETK